MKKIYNQPQVQIMKSEVEKNFLAAVSEGGVIDRTMSKGTTFEDFSEEEYDADPWSTEE